MQQSPFNASTDTPDTAVAPDNLQTTQHGLSHQDATAPPGLSQGDLAGGSEPLPIAGRRRGSPASSATSDYGLNTPTASPRPGNKIFEYESALTPISRRSSDERLFEVIDGPGRGGLNGSPIANLPNELLTHALAHLSAADLHTVALVSHRFHSIVTSPHSWRAAFARFFPGQTRIQNGILTGEEQGVITDKRVFARLTTLATWRSEYINRSHLLRSLQRGKPMQLVAPSGRVLVQSSRSGTSLSTNPTVLYESQCFGLVNHVHGTFEYGNNKQYPRFIHGGNDFGLATLSDPQSGLGDKWGVSLPPPFIQFLDTHPGDSLWGLGSGEVIGNPNVMDVSQPHGMIYGSGSPGGAVYFRAVTEQRGRLLPKSSAIRAPELGIPYIDPAQDGISAIWIAKGSTIPSLSEGMVGMLSGHHSGTVTAYSLGANDLREARIKPGELTARWILCPGVPIIALAVDENHSLKRQAQNRIWAVALNALGELFYLTKFPKRAPTDYLPLRSQDISDPDFDRLAWINGRTVNWGLVETSRRLSRPDPYDELEMDGSYTPRSSWNGACLSKAQIQAETREIEEFLRKRPKDFQKICLGWDMRRQLTVDFAGDDGHNAGEALLVVECGLEEGSIAAIKRYTRIRFDGQEESLAMNSLNIGDDDLTPVVERGSLFGPSPTFAIKARPALATRRTSELSYSSTGGSPERNRLVEEWRQSTLSFAGTRNIKVAATAIDSSKFATLTISEDSVTHTSMSGGSTAASSPLASPSPFTGKLLSEVPGQRARFFAVGTSTGSIYVWDTRAANSRAADIINSIDPVSIIHTDSPEISCLALTSLQLVHGGNDGLVQVWDPLGSMGNQPLRTLNSRFSSRARRRLAQAQASVQGVGINLFAAGAISLDPDPTVLRGIVSLGTQLKYWAFSSSPVDQYRGSKRRLRKGNERGSNTHGGERLTGTVRNANLKGYIARERAEMEREKRIRDMERADMDSRFGTDMLSEEEAMVYARMLSEEAALEDAMRRSSASSTPVLESRSWSVSAGSPARSHRFSSHNESHEEDDDADVAEAIARSLEEAERVKEETRRVEVESKFGTDMMSEEEAMAYARMLSEETALQDARRGKQRSMS